MLMGNAVRMMNAHHEPAFDDGDGEGSDFQNARFAVSVACTISLFWWQREREREHY